MANAVAVQVTIHLNELDHYQRRRWYDDVGLESGSMD